jgi:transposase
VVHRNAPLSETGRLRLARCIVEDGWPLRRAAERFQVSATTAGRWAGRYRSNGAAGMADRSSRPHRSPARTPTRTERRIIKVRVLRRWGPARIGYLLGLHPSTVHRVLTRYGLAKLRWLDRPTGRVIRRMEPAHCGEIVHVDVKKLGRIPAGGGWRMLGRTVGNRNSKADRSSGRHNKYRNPTHGHHFLHTAIDGHSRLAYSELLIATLGTWLRHHSVQTAAQGSSSRSSVQTDWHCDRRLSTPRHVPPPVALRYPRGLPRRIGTTATTIGTRRFMFGPRVVSKCTSACCTSHLARRNA